MLDWQRSAYQAHITGMCDILGIMPVRVTALTVICWFAFVCQTVTAITEKIVDEC